MNELKITGLAEGMREWSDLDHLPGRVDNAADVAEGAVGSAVPVASILEGIPIDPAATHCSVVSRDGAYTASIPVDDVRGGGWLAFALEGKPLPADKGGPLRLTVAQGTTLCWNVKDVGELRFTEGKQPDNVPAKPKH